jgi:magnesium transporter
MLYANPGAGPRTGLAQAPDAVWLDLLEPSDAEREAAAQAVGFAIPSRTDIAEIESSSRLSNKGGVLYLNSPVSYRDDDGRSAIAPVGFILSPARFVTIRYAAMKTFDAYEAQFATLKAPGSAEAFTGLIEAMVDHLADVLETVAAELDRLSRLTFRNGAIQKRSNVKWVTSNLRTTLTGVGHCGQTIDNLRDTLLGLGRIAGYVQQTGASWVADDIKQRLATVRQDIASLNDYDQQLTAKTAFLLDAIMGFINIEQNDVVRVLTVASVVGIPPTFVVGLYGMNFKNMPEYDWHWGYEWGWAMIVVSVIVPLVWFKVKGWL